MKHLLKSVVKKSNSIVIKKDEYLIMRFDVKENLSCEFIEILKYELGKAGIKGIIIPTQYPIEITTAKQS